MNRTLQEYSHLRHGFQVANDGASRGVAHGIGFLGQAFQDDGDFFSKVWVFHGKQQIFVAAFPERILNIHPSLLPAFPGLESQKQALEHGVKFAGCTVHFVDENLDAGPILLQAVVPVLDDDDERALSERILKEEHRIYSEAVKIVLEGKYQIAGRRVLGAK